MSFTNFQKTIALSGGVLVLSIAVALVVIAWTGPTAGPPANNAPAPINTGALAQTKTGDLTVGNLSLDDGTGEGDIRDADEIIGYNDLQLRANEIKFYTGGTERMAVGADGNLYVPGLTDCFLQVDATGKVKCYTGGTPPGGDLFNASQNEILNVDWCEFHDADLSHIFSGGDNKDRVIKVKYHQYATYGNYYFHFYVDDGSGEQELEYEATSGATGSITKIWYYHIPNMFPNDVTVRIAVSSTVARNSCCTGTNDLEAWVYELNAQRDDVNWASSQGDILYYYAENTIGKMFIPTVPNDFHQSPPVSVIISAKDEKDVKISVE